MADRMNQEKEDGGLRTEGKPRTEDRGLRTEGLSRRSRAFDRHAAQRYAPIRHLYSVLCFLSVFCPLSSVFCYAGELADPTRPPAILAEPVVAASGATEAQPTGLRSIIISKTRRAAIIDGETVELGGKYGDAKLIEVNEGSVVLMSAQERQVLTLFPEVKMVSRNEVKTKPESPENKARLKKDKADQAASKAKK